MPFFSDQQEGIVKSNLTTTQRRELKRFVEAQEGVYASVLEELAAGKKMSHWMWFPGLLAERGFARAPEAVYEAGFVSFRQNRPRNFWLP